MDTAIMSNYSLEYSVFGLIFVVIGIFMIKYKNEYYNIIVRE